MLSDKGELSRNDHWMDPELHSGAECQPSRKRRPRLNLKEREREERESKETHEKLVQKTASNGIPY